MQITKNIFIYVINFLSNYFTPQYTFYLINSIYFASINLRLSRIVIRNGWSNMFLLTAMFTLFLYRFGKPTLQTNLMNRLTDEFI